MKIIILYILSLFVMMLFPSKFFTVMFLMSTLTLMLTIWDSSTLSMKEMKEILGYSNLCKLLKSLYYGNKDK